MGQIVAVFELDKVRHIHIERNGENHNFISTINSIGTGLTCLYNSTKAKETEITARHPGGSVFMALSTELVAFEQIHHWYAVSACNYIRMMGLASAIALGEIDWPNFKIKMQSKEGCQEIKQLSLTHAKQVSEYQTLKNWRDKVSAHSLSIDPNYRDDDEFSLAYAFMPNKIVFIDGKLKIGAMQYGGFSYPEFSVTEIHEGLRARYCNVLG